MANFMSEKDQAEELALKERMEDPLVVQNIPVIVDCREVDPPDTTEVVQYIAYKATALAAELECGPAAIVVSRAKDGLCYYTENDLFLGSARIDF